MCCLCLSSLHFSLFGSYEHYSPDCHSLMCVCACTRARCTQQRKIGKAKDGEKKSANALKNDFAEIITFIRRVFVHTFEWSPQRRLLSCAKTSVPWPWPLRVAHTHHSTPIANMHCDHFRLVHNRVTIALVTSVCGDCSAKTQTEASGERRRKKNGFKHIAEKSGICLKAADNAWRRACRRK